MVLGQNSLKLTVIEAALEDVFSDIARLHLDHRPGAEAGKIIMLTVGGKTAYAVARGLRSGTSKGQIALDSAMRERLDVKANQVYEFEIKPAGFWGSVCWAWHSTDAMPRVAARLGAISVGLGVLGVLLGLFSLYLTLCPALGGGTAQ